MVDLVVNHSGANEYEKFARMLVVGPSGSGKTRFALTAPNPVWAAVKPGFTTLALAGNVPFVNITKEEDLLLLKIAIENGRIKADTLVVDCLDELQKLLLDEHLVEERRDVLKADDWNWISQRLTAIFEGLSELPVNIIYITHTKDVGADDSVVVKPNIQGSFSEQVHRFVDYAFYLETSSFDEPDTVIQIMNDENEFLIEADRVRVNKSVFRTRPTVRYDWVHDHTNTLPEFFDLNFEDDFARILEARGNVELTNSISVTLEDILDEKVQDAPEKVELPGMSSQDKIAKVLKKK